ncbi:MAG: hypothetical protein QXP59_01405 [Saccharolobus sp.]
MTGFCLIMKKYVVEFEGETEELIRLLKLVKGKARARLVIEIENPSFYAIINRHYKDLIIRKLEEK